MKYKRRLPITIFYCISLFITVACKTPPSGKLTPEKHLANLSLKGASLCVDKIDSRSIMGDKAADKTTYVSFLIGVTDSSKTLERHGSITRELYLQYKMDKDWVAVLNGDSLRPVFFQHRPGFSTQKEEGVLVFETPAGQQPDTLIYADSFGSWGTQVVVLDQK